MMLLIQYSLKRRLAARVWAVAKISRRPASITRRTWRGRPDADRSVAHVAFPQLGGQREDGPAVFTSELYSHRSSPGDEVRQQGRTFDSK
jgi:hypothetical protein